MDTPPELHAVLTGSQRHAILQTDAYDGLALLPPASVDLLLTSPPYWGLRDYEMEHNWNILDVWQAEGHPDGAVPSYEWYRANGGVLGLEPLPEWYVANLVAILDRAKGALKPGGSLWLNLGDTYFARWSSIRQKGRQGLGGAERLRRKTPMGGFRQEKNLLLIPARVAIAMQDRRWILRNDLIWYKPNVPPRPETDRLAATHEHFFHFVKRPTEGRARYYYELNAAGETGHDVQQINVQGGRDGHSATFPTRLIEPRIRSSCPPDGVVLDPFLGTGTTLLVATTTGRRGIGFDLNPRFIEVARSRLREEMASLFSA
ncbi:site-specific DNA-methyltransferase [uncultured Deinococcus sp.]|uniref:DNA-methyltransferase n=1 Tax=uncultured Deinococcus sp. TaxID=158789 RepID=UPI0025DE87D7|nr:site-specific DNA-methyltransferase [uncultured Deinococcus sp.]